MSRLSPAPPKRTLVTPVLKSVLAPGKCCSGRHCTCKLTCECGCKRCLCSGGFK